MSLLKLAQIVQGSCKVNNFHRASFYASETQEILEKYFLRIGGALIPSIIPVADGVFTEEEREIRELKSA